MSLFSRVLSMFCFAWAALFPGSVHAQPPCNSAYTATFAYQDQGGYVYSFSAQPASGVEPVNMEWAVAGFGYNDFSVYPIAYFQFPGPGEYLACLRSGMTDYFGDPCVSLHCELITVPVDVDCAGLVAGFNIVPQGETIQFSNATIGASSEATVFWDFGDGTTSNDTSPLHTYPGAGPYQACVTITSGACTSRACNWIYLGPADVPCETLLHPAIGVIQYERTIAAFDQSITSGMNSQISWDLGDGSTAVGSPVIHTYAYDGVYNVCGDIGLWGPLTPDTCDATACVQVSTFIAASVGDPASTAALRVYPVPFMEGFTVENSPIGPAAHWQLEDIMGRTRSSGIVPRSGTFVVDGTGLPDGVYLLRTFSGAESRVVRVVKTQR